jgi:hypothetical protein
MDFDYYVIFTHVKAGVVFIPCSRNKLFKLNHEKSDF